MNIRVYVQAKCLIVTILMLVSSGFAQADSIRCGNALIREGDTTIEVKLKCGQPYDEEYIGQAKINHKYVNVERYTYIQAKGQFIKILEFHDGNLVKILNGPRT